MATNTSYLGLTKPAQSDLYNVDVFNGNSDTVDTNAQKTAANLATIEAVATASKPYAVGEYLVLNGILYKVTQAIANGGALVVGTNIAQDTVGTELKSLKDALSNLVHDATIPSGTISDSFGFIDTSLNVTNHVIIAAYAIGSTNQSIRVSNLANGNYRVQIVSCADNSGQGKVLTSGTYSTITLWYIDR